MQRKIALVRALAAAVISGDDLALTAGGMPSGRSSNSSGNPPRIDTSQTQGSGSHSYTTTPTEMYKDSNPGRDRHPWRTWDGETKHHSDGTTSYSGPKGTWHTR
jgi:hypothetical protein